MHLETFQLRATTLSRLRGTTPRARRDTRPNTTASSVDDDAGGGPALEGEEDARDEPTLFGAERAKEPTTYPRDSPRSASPKVPYDRLRSVVKARTKHVADEVAAAHDALATKTSHALTRIRGDVGDADGARREFVDTLRATEERLLRLKRTLAEDFETERALVDRIEARVAHLRELPCGDTPPNADPETTARRRRARNRRVWTEWSSTTPFGAAIANCRARREGNGVEHLVDIDAHESGLDASVAMRRDGAYLPAITWLDSIEETQETL